MHPIYVEMIQESLNRKGCNLTVDGDFGPKTCKAFLKNLGVVKLENFRGDLGWIHEQEGHAGGIYWPGGASGLTIDPGIDLFHNPEELYGLEHVLSPGSVRRIRYFAAMKLAGRSLVSRAARAIGAAAKRMSDAETVKAWLKIEGAGCVSIALEDAAAVFPEIAAKYWDECVDAFPGLGKAPGFAQTAMLSACYNMGAKNRRFKERGVAGFIAAKDWRGLRGAMESIAESYTSKSIRDRRIRESQLIAKFLPEG